nr:hypothetical protein CFP56_74723 [Quercus suber]
MQAWNSLGTRSQSERCSFHPLLREASLMATIEPLRDDDPSLQACGLVVLFFTPSDANSAPLDASSCTVAWLGRLCARASNYLACAQSASFQASLGHNSGPCAVYLP